MQNTVFNSIKYSEVANSKPVFIIGICKFYGVMVPGVQCYFFNTFTDFDVVSFRQSFKLFFDLAL